MTKIRSQQSESFYTEGAEELFLLPGERQRLLENGVRTAESDSHIDTFLLNALQFPARCVSEVEYEIDRNIVAPSGNLDHCFLPGSISDFQDIDANGKTLEDLSVEALSPFFHGSSLVPLVPEVFSRYVFDNLNPRHLEMFESGNLNTPMGLVSKNYDWLFGWHFDLQYSFICTTRDVGLVGTPFEDVPFWRGFFDEKVLQVIPPKHRNAALFRRYLFPNEKVQEA